MVALEIEDATNLGGPMGTEHTTTIGTEYFSTVDKAKQWANKQKVNSWAPKWGKYGKEWAADVGCRIYTIRIVEVRE